MEPESDGTSPVARPRRHLPGPRGLATAATVLVVALVAVIGVLSFRLGGESAAEAAAAAPKPTPSPTRTPTVSDLYDAVGPSVVVLRTPKDLGTGVVASSDGTIVTANHVVAGATSIQVVFADRSTATAAVATADTKHDVATLKLTSQPTATIVPATLGGGIAVGAPVVAIGNPLGLTYSVSSGVVSGEDRTAATSNGSYSGLIQFDASVNPGSSGGPLLDGTGAVVGIVVSIADPGRDDAFAGIGFAVPIGTALGGGGSGTGPGGPQI